MVPFGGNGASVPLRRPGVNETLGEGGAAGRSGKTAVFGGRSGEERRADPDPRQEKARPRPAGRPVVARRCNESGFENHNGIFANIGCWMFNIRCFKYIIFYIVKSASIIEKMMV